MHWATQYVGIPYQLGARGPDAYDCFGLVRHVQKVHYGRAMSDVAIGTELPQDAALNAVIRHEGWRLAERPEDGCVLLCRSASGPHVGVVLHVQGAWLVLHATGGNEAGSVCVTPLDELGSLGYAKQRYYVHAHTSQHQEHDFAGHG